MAVSLNLVGEYSKIYPEQVSNVYELANGIPKNLIINIATHFLMYQTHDKQEVIWNKVKKYWFSNTISSDYIDLISRLQRSYTNNLDSLTILTTYSSLKLLQLGLDIKETKQFKSDSQVEIDIFKIYMLFNEEIINLQLDNLAIIKRKYSIIEKPLKLFLLSFSTSEFENYIYGREFFCQSVKSIFLFKFLENDINLKEHYEIFKNRFKINNLFDYYNRIIPLVQYIVNKKDIGFVQVALDPSKSNYDDDKLFFEKISVQDFDPFEDIDFKTIRSRPVIKMSENVYRITHPVFITDKIYKGIFFELSFINSELSDNKKIKEIRTYITNEFSEKILLYKIIEYSVSEKYIRFTGSDLQNLGIEAAPDYYIRDQHNIMVFENKDILFSGKVKSSFSFQQIEEELKKKLYRKEDGKAVGINQLINSIKNILEKTFQFDNNYECQNLSIYPVIVLHDIVYDAPGLNSLLNHWFQLEVSDLKSKFSTVKIKPLVILSIDTLIRTAELIKSEKLSLFEMLDNYYKNVYFDIEGDVDNNNLKTYLPSSKIIENLINVEYKNFIDNNHVLEFANNYYHHTNPPH
jgi:hypothetical protein